MSDQTAIEWTDATWNPVTGCDRISPGCDNCYAMTLAKRLKAMGSARYQNDGNPRTSGPGFRVTLHDEPLDQPLRWSKPRRVFVNSMSDLFHEDIPQSWIAKVFAVMAMSPQHTFQVLTKRPQRMARLLADPLFKGDVDYAAFEINAQRSRTYEWVDGYTAGSVTPSSWLPNVWLGTSIELNRYSFRADHLRATPAAVRFISAEPLLGPLPSISLRDIDWVIVGGESGRGAATRPMDPAWVRALLEECRGTAFFFKQWGEFVPYEQDPQPPFWASQHGDFIDGHCLPAELSQGDRVDGWWAPDPLSDAIYRRVGKKASGRMLDGRTWDEMPDQGRTSHPVHAATEAAPTIQVCEG